MCGSLFSEYYAVVTIPAGARSIRVMELNTSNSYLAVRDTQRHYYLNGHWTVDWPGRHPIAGAIFEYKRPYNRPESLISNGPTNETLVIEVKDQWINNCLLFFSTTKHIRPLPFTFISHFFTPLLDYVPSYNLVSRCAFHLITLTIFAFRFCYKAGTQVYAGNTRRGNLKRKRTTTNTIIHGPSYALSAQQLVLEVCTDMNARKGFSFELSYCVLF